MAKITRYSFIYCVFYDGKWHRETQSFESSATIITDHDAISCTLRGEVPLPNGELVRPQILSIKRLGDGQKYIWTRKFDSHFGQEF